MITWLQFLISMGISGAICFLLGRGLVILRALRLNDEDRRMIEQAAKKAVVNYINTMIWNSGVFTAEEKNRFTKWLDRSVV